MPEAGCQLAGCQAGVTCFAHAKFCTCGIPNKSAFLSFSTFIILCRRALSLSKAPVSPGTCCYCYQSLSPRFSTARRFFSSGFQSGAAIEACRRARTPDLIKAAAWFVMAAPAFLSSKSLDLTEDFVIDLDTPISETDLNFGPLHHTKQLLADNSQTVSPRLYSNLSQFALEPTYPYPELVHWSVSNFVPST